MILRDPAFDSSPRRLSRATVIAIHSAAIARFGGVGGIRDEGLLDSALAQPFQTFDGADLYPTLSSKAARYAFGVIANHPFIDGNKRTGAAILGVFLRLNGCTFDPPASELFDMIIGVAQGGIPFETLASWVANHIS